MQLRVSFAQNREDIYLSRVFTTDHGLYIDAGAAHPNDGSVTTLFYERGWSGINVEPQRQYHQELCRLRPRDTNLNVLLSNKSGVERFFLVGPSLDQTGRPRPSDISTADKDQADIYRRQGFAVEETEIETRTLAEICASHVKDRDISFLKIDVEGHERKVLEGADFTRWRPRVMVIEATVPNSRIASHELWEDLVLHTGYTFAWFDGLNRYYIRKEEYDTLGPVLSGPLSIFDGAVLPAWMLRMIIGVSRAYSNGPDALRQRLSEFLHQIDENPAALSRLASGPYRDLLDVLQPRQDSRAAPTATRP